MSRKENPEECCPVFDPDPWDDKVHLWENKHFIMDTIPEFLHIPLSQSYYSRVVSRMWKMAVESGAAPEMKDFLLLAYDPSPWKGELYMAVTKAVEGIRNIDLSGTFISKLFDGPYNHVPKYIKAFRASLTEQGKEAVKYYFYFTTCPKCARKYGHNYIVAIAEINS